MYKVIFTDFFDTLMFRHVHPLLVGTQAVKALSRKFGVTVNVMTQLRNQNMRLSLAERYAAIYRRLKEQGYLPDDVDTNGFVSVARDIECAAEIGVQYPNTRLLKRLQKEKQSGTRIYIVSDFHLGKDEFRKFLIAQNIDLGIFDDIFVSDDCRASKAASGALYTYVLDHLSIKAEDVLMIGDNAKVDGVNARALGLKTEIHRHYAAKAKYQLHRFLHRASAKRIVSTLAADCYRYNNPFAEYAVVFWAFARRLYDELTLRQQRAVTFLAREGHFLKRVFDDYNQLAIANRRRIESRYFKCSRRAAQSISETALAQLVYTQISPYDYLMSYGFTSSQVDEIRRQHSESLTNFNWGG